LLLCCVISSSFLLLLTCIDGCMFDYLHASHRVISSFSVSRCTWQINAILSFVENCLRFVSNGGASSALPLVGVGCLGVLCCPKSSSLLIERRTSGWSNEWKNRYVQLLGHSEWRNRTFARHLFGVRYQVCNMSSKSSVTWFRWVLCLNWNICVKWVREQCMQSNWIRKVTMGLRLDGPSGHGLRKQFSFVFPVSSTGAVDSIYWEFKRNLHITEHGKYRTISIGQKNSRSFPSA
jgi:hypothetical protein